MNQIPVTVLSKRYLKRNNRRMTNRRRLRWTISSDGIEDPHSDVALLVSHPNSSSTNSRSPQRCAQTVCRPDSHEVGCGIFEGFTCDCFCCYCRVFEGGRHWLVYRNKQYQIVSSAKCENHRNREYWTATFETDLGKTLESADAQDAKNNTKSVVE